jgi:hypothetical protein
MTLSSSIIDPLVDANALTANNRLKPSITALQVFVIFMHFLFFPEKRREPAEGGRILPSRKILAFCRESLKMLARG